jgi:hypothetical protein
VRISFFLIVLHSLVCCSLAQAVDYSKVIRPIAKEPAYQQPPKYALLLFGKECMLRVWVVLDGDIVYLDRNGDGDLTGANERFARMEDCRDVELNDPDGKTRYLIRHLNTYKNREQDREVLHVDVEIKGPLMYRQYCSVQLKGSTRQAHIAHFHGPLSISPQTVNWKVPAELALVNADESTDLRGHIGTMSAEHGCWVVVWSHNGNKSAFPDGVFPFVDVEFPPKAPGGAHVRKRYPLDKFC